MMLKTFMTPGLLYEHTVLVFPFMSHVNIGAICKQHGVSHTWRILAQFLYVLRSIPGYPSHTTSAQNTGANSKMTY